MAPRRKHWRRRRSLLTSLLTLALVPSTALALIWAENTYQLLSQGMDLAEQSRLGRTIDPRLNSLRWNLEVELRKSAGWLADSDASPSALESQRNRTDASVRALGNLRQKLADAPAHVRNAEMPFVEALERFPLKRLRSGIDQRAVSGPEVIAAFTSLINMEITSVFEVRQVPQGSLVSQAQPLSMLIEIEQAIHMEDTVMSQALPSGKMSPEQRVAFMSPLGLQRSLLAVLPSIQSRSEQAAVAKVTNTAAWKRMVAVENAVITARAESRSGTALPAAAQWRSSLDQVEAGLEDQIAADGTKLLASQNDTAYQTLRHEGAISLAGLLAVIISATLSWRVSRSLLRRMAGLKAATLELAHKRLPDVVDRLNRGETVDVKAEAMELDYGTDQIGQVAQAFNAVQRTGISSAVTLAEARRGFQKAILVTVRRAQNLVNGQLALLDEFERKHQEPDVLKDLYQLDSRASQLRRYEENLLVISGGSPGRRWNEPVALADVLRSAVGEVSEYQRVTVSADHRVSLAGHAVADVIHLLAELVQNAVHFSPPVCPVFVRGDTVGKGVAVEVEDRGVGMSDPEYAVANQRLAEPPPFDVLSLKDDARLGMFVIARLADRHCIKITLRASAFGGTSAVVLIPEVLVVRETAQRGDAAEAQAQAQAQVQAQTPAPAPAPSGLDAEEPDVFAPRRAGAPVDSPAQAAPMAPVSFAPAPTANGSTATDQDPPRSLPPLPERIPQASLAQELRHTPTLEAQHTPSAGPLPSAEQAARTMSAFQRGTTQARHSGEPPRHRR